MPEPRIIVALDFPDAEQALQLARKLSPKKCRVKVGKTLFTRAGPDVVRALTDSGFDVFLDLKYHDIPETVAGACRAAAELGVWMMNVHAAGGESMLQAAREAISEGDTPPPLLIGVTLLTSISGADLDSIGIQGPVDDHVLHLARLAAGADLDGVVAAASECKLLRRKMPEDFILVTPGIRPAGSAPDDQARVMTPGEAIRAGSNYLVIGRPISQALDPAQALDTIVREIDQAVTQ
ncbi:MAG: orotidine-5'-phosphate decarboxylase [Gammaproteobacteria bacterium]